MRRIGLVLLTVIATGCVATYTRSDLAREPVKLQTDRVVAIATPANGSYGGREYSGSGVSTAAAVRAAFAKFARDATVIQECKTLSCLQSQVGDRADYIVIPEILHWEDRATEWSGIKDKLEVKLAVYDARSGDLLASSALAGKSKWATFGGDHPQDLLPEPINAYVSSLF
jgi:hypothetical protein